MLQGSSLESECKAVGIEFFLLFHCDLILHVDIPNIPLWLSLTGLVLWSGL